MPLIKLLQKMGYEVHVYASIDEFKEEVENTGAICHDVPFPRSPFGAQNIRTLFYLKKEFAKENLKMIHVHTPIAGILARIAARMAKIPLVISTAHGFYFHKGSAIQNWIFYYPPEWLLSRWTDVIITINEEDYRRALRFPVRKRVALVKGVGINHKRFQLGRAVRELKREELGITESEFVLINVAQLDPNKNQALLIKVTKRLKDQGIPVRTLLIGKGETEKELRLLAETLELDKEVIFFGFSTEIPELLAASDVYLQLSKREGLPKAVMEAIASGKPIIASNIRGNRDLVLEGKSGYLVEVGDVEGTAERIKFLYYSPSLCKEMSDANLLLAKSLDISVVTEQMEEIYQKILDSDETAQTKYKKMIINE
jgi:glycosyltransferase involved in cell wall biosynthesis